VVSARQIRTSSLSEISTILGLIQSFEFRTPGNPGRGENYSGVVIKTDGIETYFEDNRTGVIEQDGDVKFGSNVDEVGTTGFHIFSNPQTYNGESMGAGDILFGDNSSGKSNILWDASTSEMKFRQGILVTNKMSSSSLLAAGVKLYRTSSMSIATNFTTSVQWQEIAYDDLDFADLDADNTRLTIPSGYDGRYEIVTNLAFDSNATGVRTAYITVNNQAYGGDTKIGNSGGIITPLLCYVEVELSAGDFVKVLVRQESGGNLNLVNNTIYEEPFVIMKKIR
jgi:hypothetical protein